MTTFRFERGRVAALSVLLGAAIAACADAPSSPSATVPRTSRPFAEEAGGGPNEPNGNAYGLVKCHRSGPVQRSAVIGPEGGTLRVGDTYLVVPPGALSERVRMTAKVLDTIAAVELEPHGLRFALPVGLAIDVSGCAVREEQHPVLLYLDDDGEVRETIPGDLDEDGDSFFARIVHFSVYAVGV